MNGRSTLPFCLRTSSIRSTSAYSVAKTAKVFGEFVGHVVPAPRVAIPLPIPVKVRDASTLAFESDVCWLVESPPPPAKRATEILELFAPDENVAAECPPFPKRATESRHQPAGANFNAAKYVELVRHGVIPVVHGNGVRRAVTSAAPLRTTISGRICERVEAVESAM